MAEQHTFLQTLVVVRSVLEYDRHHSQPYTIVATTTRLTTKTSFVTDHYQPYDSQPRNITTDL